MRAFNSSIFNLVELDSNVLTPQIIVVAQVRSAARYKGVVTNPDKTTQSFSLVVVPSPAEPTAELDVSQSWNPDTTFTVVEKGYVVVSVGSGEGGQTIRIYNDQEVLLDNQALQAGQLLVLRVLRPGVHTITDQTGGATCNLTVAYPEPGKPLTAGAITLQVNQLDPTHTAMDPKDIAATVTQALSVHVQDKSHIVTTLISTTDRVEGKLVTRAKVKS
jgi:hypothetical protein